MKTAVLDTANKLIKAQGKVTTLEIKAELIKTQSQYFWTQDFVSKTMDEYQGAGKFDFVDTGVYRIYTTIGAGIVASTGGTGITTGTSNGTMLVVSPNTTTTVGKLTTVKVKKASKVTVAVKASKISRTKALDLIVNNKGHFFTATFVKDGGQGDVRTINCQYMKNQAKASPACIMVKEANKMKANVNAIRQINIGTLRSLRIGGQNYVISAK